MSPIALSDAELIEVQAAAALVPHHLRSTFLQQLAAELRDKSVLVLSIVLLTGSRARSTGGRKSHDVRLATDLPA
jgi:hypothetical protein